MKPDSKQRLRQARKCYEETPVPEALPYLVRSCLREKPQKAKWARVMAPALVCLCFLFVTLLNCSEVFAQTVSQVPLLGEVAKIFTFRSYSEKDPMKNIDGRVPALSQTGNTALEKRVNQEIQTKIDGIVAKAKTRAQQEWEAYRATGGSAGDFMPVIVTVDYSVKCSNQQILSFVLESTEVRASAYTQLFCYNIDMATGNDLTLQDLLGDGYEEHVNASIRRQIARREAANPDLDYFEGEMGFQGIKPDQSFFINDRGNPVIVFEKYEIAPGSMGIQEFEITP